MRDQLHSFSVFFLFFICVSFSTSSMADDNHVTITQFEVNKLPQFSLYISVTDNTGKPVRLSSAALSPEKGLVKVFEDGQKLRVLEISPVLDLTESEISRFYIVLVLDNSDSMAGDVKDVKIAADRFIDQIRDTDKISIVAFAPYYEPYKARVVQNFTNIKSVIKSNTLMFNLTRKTYLYDAIYVACLQLQQEKTISRKAVVVLSDGKDIGSNAALKNLIGLAKFEDIPIYSIDFSRSLGNRNLQKISEETNGKYFRASKSRDLMNLYNAILEQLQGQYRITYTAENENWSEPTRQMRVEVQQSGKYLIAERDYNPDVAKLQYLALRYREAMDRVDSADYLKYINNYPASDWCDDIQFRLGVFYQQRGFYDEAIEIYDELSARPETEWRDDVLFRKGKIYENLGDFTNAINTYEQMVETYPDANDTPEALLGIARANRELDDFDKAESSYMKIKNDYPGSEVTDEALLELSNLKIQQRRYAEAKLDLIELVENFKESNSTSDAYLSLASLAEREGALENAVDYCDKAAHSTSDPNSASRAFSRKGDLLFNLGNFNSAIESYEVIINQYETNNYHDEALLGLAKSYREQKEFGKMRYNYDQIKSMKAKNEDVSFNLDEINDVSDLIPPNKAKRVSTLSGASLETLPESEISFPLEVNIKPIVTPDQFKNLSIAGSIYDVMASVDTFQNPVQIALPYEESWLNSSDKKVDDFKIYSYRDNKWQIEPGCQSDKDQKIVKTKINHLSLKAIMFQPPRVIRFDDILFEFNRADLTEASKIKVDSVITILEDSKEIRLEVQGHTDSIGTYDTNLYLSQERAETIRNHLISGGIDSSRIYATGYGEKFPIASNRSEEGRSLNRRTEFVIISKGENDVIDVQQKRLGNKYTIQIGENFKFLTRATELSEVLKKEGYAVTIQHDFENEQAVYKLWCGYFDKESEAERVAQKIVSNFKNLKFSIIER